MAILSEILALLDKWPEWKRVREAPSRLDGIDARLKALEALEAKAPVTAGKACPACGQPAMRRTGVKPDPAFGSMGVKLETWTCGACGETDEVQNSTIGT